MLVLYVWALWDSRKQFSRPLLRNGFRAMRHRVKTPLASPAFPSSKDIAELLVSNSATFKLLI